MAFPALAAWCHKQLLANGFRPRPGDPHDGHAARPRGDRRGNGRDGVEPVVGLHSWERSQHPPHFKAFHAKAVEKGLLLDVIETGFP